MARLIGWVERRMGKAPEIDRIRSREIREVPRCLLVDYLNGTACRYGLDWGLNDKGDVHFDHPCGHGADVSGAAHLRDVDLVCARLLDDTGIYQLVWHSTAHGQWAAPKARPRQVVAHLTRRADALPGDQWSLMGVAEIDSSLHATAEAAKARAQADWRSFVAFIRS